MVHLKRWTSFSDPLSFGPKFPEILVEWIAPILCSRAPVPRWAHHITILAQANHSFYIRELKLLAEFPPFVCLGLFSDTRVNQWAFYLCSLLTDRHLTASCAGQKQPRSTVPLSRNFYVRRHVNFTPENEKNRTSLNFYFCTRPFTHCFYFIYARKIYMRTQVKITPQWKSTLSRFT